MNKSESKYYNTACLMAEALILLLDKKEYEYITVKEVCQKAGVNRSTFYLHYETMNDLLAESGEYITKKFYEYMKSTDTGVSANIEKLDKKDLVFITPKYLNPYLEFIKQNRVLYFTVIKNAGLFRLDKTYTELFRRIFNPVLNRFGFAEEEKNYYLAFYINGILSLVAEWVKDGCKMPIKEVVNVIERCIRVPNAISDNK